MNRRFNIEQRIRVQQTRLLAQESRRIVFDESNDIVVASTHKHSPHLKEIQYFYEKELSHNFNQNTAVESSSTLVSTFLILCYHYSDGFHS